jgi:predicted branched-subunit amino acid permease
MTSLHPKESPPPSTSAGFYLGCRLVLPILPGMIAFGMAVGAAGARQGLSLFDNTLMNALVYAGMSQLVALEAWPRHFTFAEIAALALITATVNARLMLITASLYPWLGPLPRWQIYPTLHFVTDPGWLIAMRYRAEGGSDPAVFFSSSLLIWVVWLCSATAGYLLGVLIADPRRYGIDLVMPIFFAAMLIPLWRGPRRALPWIAAGAVALLVQHLVGGWWFIVAGAIAGSVVGGLIDDGD